MRGHHLFLFLVLLLCTEGRGQSYQSYYVPWANNIVNCEFFSSANTSDRGIAEMRSYTYNTLALTKIDSTGIPSWQNIVRMGNSQEYYMATAVTGLAGGELLVSGSYRQTNLSAVGTFIMRFDSSGTLLMQKAIVCSSPQQFGGAASLLSPDSTRLYFIGGGHNGSSNGAGQYILKTDLNGNILSQAFFQIASPSMYLSAGVVEPNGNLVLLGSWWDALFFIRLDSNLQILTTQAVNLNGILKARSIAAHPDGGYVVACHMGSSSAIIKLDSLGQVLGATCIVPNPVNQFYETGNLITNSQGRSYLVVGRTGYFPEYGNPYIICMDDTLGVTGAWEYYGSTPESILLHNDAPWFTTTSDDGVNGGVAVNYIQADTLGALGCNSTAASIDTLPLPALVSTVPSVAFFPNLSFSSFSFTPSITPVNVPLLLDYCLYDAVAGSSEHTYPSVFPNPASQYLQLPGNLAGCRYQVTDISGRVVSEGICPANGTISVGQLTNGPYILLTGLGSNKVTYPFIKN